MLHTLRVLAVILLAINFAFSQKVSQSTPIEFGLLVTDDHGEAVEGLSAADFTINYGGKPIPASLRLISSVPASALVHRADSNQGLAAAGRGLTVIVLDTLHTRADEESNIRAQIAKFIADSAAKNQPVTFLQLSPSGLKVVYDYTAADPALNASRMDAFMKGGGINAGYTDSKMHAYPEAVLSMFNVVGQANRGIPGRKSLVWLTNIVPFEVDRKSRLLVSPVSVGQGASVLGAAMPTKQNLLGDKELKELNALWRQAINALATSQTAVIPIELRGASQSGTITETLSAMKDVASITGGREMHGNNSPLSSLERFLHPQTTYALTIPADAACPREFCELSISTRRDYSALAPQGIFRRESIPPIPPADQLSRALSSPLNFQEVGFSVEMAADSATPNRKVSFRVALQPDAAVIDSATSAVAVEVGLNVLLPDGSSKQKASFNAAGTLPPEAVKQITENGMNVKGSIDLPPGEYDFKFVVHDKLHDRFGSFTVRKKI